MAAHDKSVRTQVDGTEEEVCESTAGPWLKSRQTSPTGTLIELWCNPETLKIKMTYRDGVGRDSNVGQLLLASIIAHAEVDLLDVCGHKRNLHHQDPNAQDPYHQDSYTHICTITHVTQAWHTRRR